MEGMRQQTRLRRAVRHGYELVVAIVQGGVIAAVLVTFIFQATEVEGSSMEPNVHNADMLIVDKISSRFDPYERGEIVVVDLPNEDDLLIKRIIGLEGEMVEVSYNRVYINGHLLEEAYLGEINQQNVAPFVVPAEHVYVMGDNRNNSHDSRAFGAVDVYRIVGRTKLRIWPPNDIGLLR